nr:MAG TPA: hypothetical protein [Caudoviricetes sp.]
MRVEPETKSRSEYYTSEAGLIVANESNYFICVHRKVNASKII